MAAEPMELIEGILTRRSIRALKPDPVPDDALEIIMKCLEAAPSAGNLQPWYFCIIRNAEIKDTLCKLSFDQAVVRQAPLVIAICAIPEESAAQYGDVGRDLFCIQDTAAAVQNLLLAVHGLGYAAVWIGVVKEREIAECLRLPPEQKPVALVPIGLANEVPKPMERKSWRTVTRTID